ATATRATTHTVTRTVTAAASPTATGTNVCGEICNTVCAISGAVPPANADCEALVNAVNALSEEISPTFIVAPNHVQSISSGTCRFFFENLGSKPLEFCWSSLAQTAQAAGNACLPPVKPTMTEGLCIAPNGSWEVGYVGF
ncbi:hypothetical protein BD413DRAFT_469227, partial [Trametes elegans]